MFRKGQLIKIKGKVFENGNRVDGIEQIRIIDFYPNLILTERTNTKIRETFGYKELEEIRVG